MLNSLAVCVCCTERKWQQSEGKAIFHLTSEYFDCLRFPLRHCIIQICLFFIVTSLSHTSIFQVCLTTLDPCGLNSPNVLSFALLFWSCVVVCYFAHHLVDLDDAVSLCSRAELEDTLSIISHCNTCSSSAGNYLQELQNKRHEIQHSVVYVVWEISCLLYLCCP